MAYYTSDPGHPINVMDVADVDKSHSYYIAIRSAKARGTNALSHYTQPHSIELTYWDGKDGFNVFYTLKIASEEKFKTLLDPANWVQQNNQAMNAAFATIGAEIFKAIAEQYNKQIQEETK